MKKNGGKVSEGSNDVNECDLESQFCQKIYLFHYFHTIFDEEFKNLGLESLRPRFEDLLRKFTFCIQNQKSQSRIWNYAGFETRSGHQWKLALAQSQNPTKQLLIGLWLAVC